MHERICQSPNVGLKVDIIVALVAAAWSHGLLRPASCWDRRNWPPVPVLYQPHVIAVLLHEAE
jgi:hypothetical protein